MHLFKALKRKYSVVQSFQHIQLWSSLKLRYIAELYSARDLKGWTDSTMPDGWVAALHIVHHIETYNARCWIISIFFCDTSRLSGKDSFTDLLNIFYTGFVSHLKWKTITMGRVAIGRKKKKDCLLPQPTKKFGIPLICMANTDRRICVHRLSLAFGMSTKWNPFYNSQ